MSTDAAIERRFTRTERALLRVLFAQGGACEDGHNALARTVDGGERSIQRATRRLQIAGLLDVTRRGYGRTAQILLTDAGKGVATRMFSQSADTPIGRLRTNASEGALNGASRAQSADTPIRRSPSPTAPARFAGDPHALSVARITARIAHDDSPLGLARAYIAQVEATPELARIANFLDEHGTLPVHATPTNLPELDEGLRAYFAAQARRARTREQLRNMTRGVQITRRDEE